MLCDFHADGMGQGVAVWLVALALLTRPLTLLAFMTYPRPSCPRWWTPAAWAGEG